MQCERYGGVDLLSGQETLHTLEQLQDLWVEVCMQLFRRHPALDREAPKGQAAIRELSHSITKLHTQLGVRINGESGKRFCLHFLFVLQHQLKKFTRSKLHDFPFRNSLNLIIKYFSN